MAIVKLVPHSIGFAERIFQLSSDVEVNQHLSFRDESVEDTKWFINYVSNEEKEGRAYRLSSAWVRNCICRG